MKKYARGVILDELFDLSLYQALRKSSSPELEKILDELIPVEKRHFSFWKRFFNLELNRLGFGRSLKLRFMIIFCRIFGEGAVHLVLEAIEIHGIKKYLKLWETYQNAPLGQAVKEILEDEFKHEDAIVTQIVERKIHPERIRDIFLGLNDGLIEILGVVSGLFAAFSEPSTVLLAGVTTAFAGALSMAAGGFVSTSSANEVRNVETGKKRFLGFDEKQDTISSPLLSAALVGISYFAGATIPILPVVLGARTLWVSLVGACAVNLIVSMILSFLSGMDIKKRILMNSSILILAAGLTHLIGTAVKILWGISI